MTNRKPKPRLQKGLDELTLRDLFAMSVASGYAMSGFELFGKGPLGDTGVRPHSWAERAAHDAYMVADSMLIWRELTSQISGQGPEDIWGSEGME